MNAEAGNRPTANWERIIPVVALLVAFLPVAFLPATQSAAQSNATDLLFRAAAGGHVDSLRIALEQGADIEAFVSDAFDADNALHLAAASGHTDALRFLLDAGANLHATNGFGWTAIHRAASEVQYDAVEFLLEAGIDPNVASLIGETAATHVLSYQHESTDDRHDAVVRLLLGAGLNVNQADSAGWTVLHMAAGRSGPDLVDELVDAGADIDAVNRDDRTPVLVAVSSAREANAVTLLRRGAQIRSPDEGGETIGTAAWNNHHALLRALIDRGHDVNWQTPDTWAPLLYAARDGRLTSLRLLIDAGVDLAVRKSDGWSAVMLAAYNNHTIALRRLVCAGAPAELLNEEGLSATDLALDRGHRESVEAIKDPDCESLERASGIEASVDRLNIDLANASVEGSLRAFVDAIARGADVQLRTDSDSATVFMLAAGANSIDIAQHALDLGVDAGAVDEDGWTALHWAAYRGALESIELLLALGLSPDRRSVIGETPLAIALASNHFEVADRLLPLTNDFAASATHWTPLHRAVDAGAWSLTLKMLERGVDPTISPPDGWDALTLAANRGHYAVIPALLCHGADPNRRDANGQTALEVARQHSRHAVPYLERGCVDADVNALIESRRLLEAARRATNAVDYQAASELAAASLAFAEKISFPGDPHIPLVLNQLALVLDNLRALEDAARTYERAIQASASAFGVEHEDAIVLYGNLAYVHRERNDEKAAVAAAKRGGEIASALSDTTGDHYASSLLPLASVYRWFGHADSAAAVTAEAIQILEESGSTDHELLGDAYHDLAIAQMSMDLVHEAEESVLRSLEIDSLRLVDDTGARALSDHAAHLGRLALIQSRLGRNEAALVSINQSLSVKERYADTDEAFATSLAARADILSILNREAEALEDALRVWNIYRATRPAGHRDIADAALEVAEEKRALFHPFDETLPWLRDAAQAYVDDPFRTLMHAYTVGQIGALHSEHGHLAEAESLLTRSVAMYDALDGQLGANIRFPLSELAWVVAQNGDQQAAIAIRKRVVASDSVYFGKEHNNTTVSRLWLARTLAETGLVSEARQVFQRAEVAAQNVEATTSVKIGYAITRSAIAFADDNYVDARAAEEQRLALVLQDVGSETASEAWALQAIAGLDGLEGNYVAAVQRLIRARQIMEVVTDPGHPMVADIVSDLAEVKALQGKFVEARAMLEGATAIKIDRLGPEHIDVAIQKGRLAELLFDQGDYAGAVELASETERILLRTLPPTNTAVRRARSARAIAYERLNLLDEAEAILEEAVRLELDSTFRTCVLRNNLTRVRIKQQRFEEAEQLLTACVEKYDAIPIPSRQQQLDAVRIAENLAWAYEEQGRLQAAADLYAEARSLRTELQGATHPMTLEAAGNAIRVALANLTGDESVGTSNDIEALVLENARLTTRHIDEVFPTLSLAEQRSFAEATIPLRTSTLLSACSDVSCAREAYQYLVRWKGLLLGSLRREASLARLRDVPEVTSALANLGRVRAALAALLQRPDSDDDDSVSERVATLQEEKERLERALANELPQDSFVDVLDELGMDGFRSLLGQDQVFVDIYRYHNYRNDEPHYAAILLTSLRPPQLVPLGQARLADDLLTAWRTEVTRGELADFEWNDIREVVWSPLRMAIREALPVERAKIWISPDGALARLPWNLFEIDDELLVAQIDSGRELAHMLSTSGPTSRRPQRDGITLVGDINFDLGVTDSTRMATQFADLPGTRDEIGAVSMIVERRGENARVLSGDEATSAELVSALSSTAVAHVATHGFFYGEPAVVYASRGAAAAAAAAAVKGARSSTGAASRSPLVESGLAAAGANAFDPLTGAPIGLVTAEELVGLDLSGSQLIVLSACETGRGSEITGQGVMGLRASLLTAGARSVIMSLWKVPDESTALLMQHFYEALLVDTASIGEALRTAQQKVRDDPSGLYVEPVHWAAWVVVGNADNRVTITSEATAIGGDDVNRPDENGATPIMWAAYDNDDNLVRGLLARGARLGGTGVIYDDSTKQSYFGGLLAILAARNKVDLMKHIIEARSVDVDVPEWNPTLRARNGWTPLIWAAFHGHMEMTDYLLSRGADVEFTASDRFTPLWAAVTEGHEGIARLLIEAGANPAVRDANHASLFHVKAHDEALPLLALLLESAPDSVDLYDDERMTPLHWAVGNGQVEAVRDLLAAGADVNARAGTADQWTPLFYAASGGHAQVVPELVSRGADIEATDADGWTPLIAAANGNDVATVRALVCAGANVDATDNDGQTARWHARRKVRFDIMAVLDSECSAGN